MKEHPTAESEVPCPRCSLAGEPDAECLICDGFGRVQEALTSKIQLALQYMREHPSFVNDSPESAIKGFAVWLDIRLAAETNDLGRYVVEQLGFLGVEDDNKPAEALIRLAAKQLRSEKTNAGVAQSVERDASNVDVASSSLAACSTDDIAPSTKAAIETGEGASL